MESVILFISFLAMLHGISFAKWIRTQGNEAAFKNLIILSLLSFLLPLYRLLSSP